MLLKFGAVLSIICGFLMAIYTWIHLLQCVVVRSFLRMLKLRKLAVRKLYLSRGGRTRCQGVLEHGLNLHQNIPLTITLIILRDKTGSLICGLTVLYIEFGVFVVLYFSFFHMLPI